MTASAATPSRSAIVAVLRAAGCVFAEEEAGLLIEAATTPGDLAAMVDRRAAGIPLEQVLGWAEFCGLRIAVEPGVFVPRRRSELLVREAAALVRASTGSDPSRSLDKPPVVVVDLCCGSGAIGAALVAELVDVELHAVDIAPAAVRCTARNVPAGAQVYQGDLYQPLPASLHGRVDLLVANAPYVPTEAVALLPPEAREHEPLVALDGGTDGLDVIRRVAAGAPRWLAPGGRLLIETSARQAPRVARMFGKHGLSPRVVGAVDLTATVVVGTAR